MRSNKTLSSIRQRIILLEEKLKVLKYLAENEYEEEDKDLTDDNYSLYYSTNKKESFLLKIKDSVIDGEIIIGESRSCFNCNSFDDFINMCSCFTELCSSVNLLDFASNCSNKTIFQYINGEIHSAVVKLNFTYAVGFFVYDKTECLLKLVLLEVARYGDIYYRTWNYIENSDIIKVKSEIDGVTTTTNIVVTTPDRCNFENTFPKLLIHGERIKSINDFVKTKS